MPANAARDAPADAISATTDEALGDWLPAVRPIVAPIERAAADAATLEELRGNLIGVLGDMDVDAFAELLARGTFAARVVGMSAPTGEEP